MTELARESVTGSVGFVDGVNGAYLGQVTVDPETGEGWFHFTTVGDGVGGTYVRVSPAYEEPRGLFIEPVDALATSPTSIDHTSQTFTLGGPEQPELIMELDLAGLLPYLQDLGTGDDRLASLALQLDYFDLHAQQDAPYRMHLPLSSLPIAFDQRLVFTAEHSATSEPSVWSTDEASAEHITSFPGDYFPIESLTATGDVFYFTAYDDPHGSELYRSDGTTAGTEMVADIFPGGGGSEPMHLTAAGDDLYFVALGPQEQRQLFRVSPTGQPEAIDVPAERLRLPAAVCRRQSAVLRDTRAMVTDV